MPHIDPQLRKKLRNKSEVLTEDNAHCVYLIPDEHVEEYFNYGKPNGAVSEILGKELAKQVWNMDEGEAVEANVRTMKEELPYRWKVIVYKQ